MNRNLKNIPCAGHDAQRVYSAFKSIMASDFCSYSSACFIDITSQSFEALVRNIFLNDLVRSENDDIVVIYFSGHAVLKKSTKSLGLCFFDCLDDARGIIDIESIYKLTKDSGKSVLLILDCCYSGAALEIASMSVDSSRYSILTACDDMDISTYDDAGSQFAKVLCKAIYEIKSTGDEFSLNNLSQKIFNLGYKGAMLNFGASSAKDASFILKPRSNFLKQYNDFVPRFIERVNHSNAVMREAMWYSLVDVPEPVVYDICETYFGLNGSKRSVSEASWLVRRSIGSVISCLSDAQRKEQLIYSLVSSCFWQEQCIGLIGARYLLRDQEEVYEFVTAKIADGTIVRIDAVWLANLYMGDNTQYSPEVFFNTTLIQSSWGTIEIYKTLQKSNAYKHKALEILERAISPENKKALQRYIALNGENKSNKLVQQLRKGKTRGRLPEKEKSKFLLSALYGSWRDQINVDLNNYLNSEFQTTITNHLEKAKDFSSIEFKMGLLSYFQTLSNGAKKYWRSIDWALSDKNLWVRREAIKLYYKLYPNGNNLDNCLCETDIISNLYPGLLDLMLELPKSACESQLMMYANLFIENDITSLQHAIELEYITPQNM